MVIRNKLCDEDCNHCPFLLHKNSRMVTYILNALLEKYGDGVYEVVQKVCPNLTCCFDCRVDDFVHVEGCWIIDDAVKDVAKSKRKDK